MKKLIVLFVAVAFSANVSAQTKWMADSAHSFLNFSIKHLGVSFVNGKMDKYEGSLEMKGEDVSTAKFNFTIDVNSVNTGVQMRDDHLKAADFFDTAKYPNMTFVSTEVKKVKGNAYKLTGNLTIKDVTKKVTFDLVYGGKAKDGYGNEVIGFQGKTTIDRTAYNISFDPSGAGIAKEVELHINLEFKQAK